MSVSLAAIVVFARLKQDVTRDSLRKYVYPLSTPMPCPPITVDSKDAPELAAWGEVAKDICTDWYPILTSLLATKEGNYKSPSELHFVFRNKQDAPAYTGGNEISISADWVRKHPDDLGMMVHELTHVVQHYPRNRHNTGWLVEGIADYTRWWRYEPDSPRTPINFSKAKYTDAYRTTAYFLAFASAKYNRGLVPALDLALRKAEDPLPVFVTMTGKSADDLWTEFSTSKWNP